MSKLHHTSAAHGVPAATVLSIDKAWNAFLPLKIGQAAKPSEGIPGPGSFNTCLQPPSHICTCNASRQKGNKLWDRPHSCSPQQLWCVGVKKWLSLATR